MFKAIRGWFGDDPEELMKLPRRIPDHVKHLPEGSDEWLMGAEFANSKKPGKRCYLAAQKDGAGWKAYLVSYELSLKTKDAPVTFELSLNDWKSTLRQVIEMLHSYDRQMMEADMFTRVPSSRPTYKNFANRHGVHFDAQGNLIEVQAEKPVTADTFMTRKSLNDLYNQQAKKVDYSTWQAVYDNLVNKQFEGATVEMLAGDKAYAQYVEKSQDMIAKLDKLPEYMLSDSYVHNQKRRTLENMVRYVIVDPLGFQTADKCALAQHLCDVTILVGMIRAGRALYNSMFADGLNMDPKTMEMIAEVGKIAGKFAHLRLGVDEDDALKISNVIAQGEDPNGPELPLQKIFSAFPSPAALSPKNNPAA